VVVSACVLADFDEVNGCGFFGILRKGSFGETAGAILARQLFEIFNFKSFVRHWFLMSTVDAFCFFTL